MNTFLSDTNNLKPMLTEPGITYFINATLKQCHHIKQQYQYTIFNIGLFILLFVSLGILLFYRYKGKLTPEEIEQKELIKKQYILSKIRNFQNAKVKAQQELITGLPHWDNEIDIMNDTPIHKILAMHKKT